MKKLVICTCLFAIIALEACSGSPKPSEANGDVSASGEALVASKCGSCHGLDKVHATQADAQQWTAIVQKMRELGAPLTDEQARSVVEHLARPIAE